MWFSSGSLPCLVAEYSCAVHPLCASMGMKVWLTTQVVVVATGDTWTLLYATKCMLRRSLQPSDRAQPRNQERFGRGCFDAASRQLGPVLFLTGPANPPTCQTPLAIPFLASCVSNHDQIPPSGGKS